MPDTTGIEMEAAVQHLASSLGARRLLAHCAALDGHDARPAAGERLSELIGSDLAHLLVSALAPSRGARPHNLP